MSEPTLDELVEMKVNKILRKKGYSDKRRICAGWLKLSAEISEYCTENVEPGFAFSYVQNSIYYPIKYVLGLRRIDDIAEQDIKLARAIFYFIKNKRNGYKSESKRKMEFWAKEKVRD
ncbi:hypothetical protein [Liquorilactobacillus satsumensis]|uniref:hypothetical protein n=1 Tax=Liquorilactobacillus TaxID=2767888 RepID=UPI0021C34ABE|nr:hypothetical protein [Liquorilactobacillus satsumensis]MCP9313844.1 hypothetical protein [Liquorilactobacillus satsumensis]MCP9360985.1 hypothetical protein [Liquorilactobacillus satsumensis]